MIFFHFKHLRRSKNYQNTAPIDLTAFFTNFLADEGLHRSAKSSAGFATVRCFGRTCP